MSIIRNTEVCRHPTIVSTAWRRGRPRTPETTGLSLCARNVPPLGGAIKTTAAAAVWSGVVHECQILIWPGSAATSRRQRKSEAGNTTKQAAQPPRDETDSPCRLYSWQQLAPDPTPPPSPPVPPPLPPLGLRPTCRSMPPHQLSLSS